MKSKVLYRRSTFHIQSSLLLVAILLAGCTVKADSDDQVAKIGRYYFEIIQEVPDETTNQIQEAITAILPGKTYAITNASGYEWPFFQEYKLTENVLRSELMPPHTKAHRLLKMDAGASFEEEDARLNIVLKRENDEYSFDMIMYRWRDHRWVRTVNTGNHKVAKEDYTSTQELTSILYKKIVRYSFK